MGKIKAVFLDIDNTILDFDEYVRESMITGFKEFNLKPYEPWMYDTFTIENGKLWHKLEKGELDFETLLKIRWNIIFKAIGIDFDGVTFEAYFRKFLNTSAIPVDDAYELLEFLKEKYIICIASNGPFEQQTQRLSIAKMDEYIDFYFISGKIGHSKPSKEFFKAAFSDLNQSREDKILPEETIILGDSLTADIKGGNEYGIKTIFYSRKPNPVINDIVPDKIVYSLKEAIEAIKSMDN